MGNVRGEVCEVVWLCSKWQGLRDKEQGIRWVQEAMEMMANATEVINGKGKKKEYSRRVEVGYGVGVGTGKFCSRACVVCLDG
jgi:hypothetical protein